MQIAKIIEGITSLLEPPAIYVVVISIVLIVLGVAIRRRPKIIKQMRKMMSRIEKGKPIKDVPVKSRQDIITESFGEKMHAVGLQPSTDSGHIPASRTPLAKYLLDHGVTESTTDAIVSELSALESKEAVKEILDAAAEGEGVSFTSVELDMKRFHNDKESGRSENLIELLQNRQVKGMPRSTLLVVVGLMLFLSGGVFLFQPIRLVMAEEQMIYAVGPEFENSVDFRLSLDYGQSSQVLVSFEDDAQSGHREIWFLVFYHYPTKLLIEATARLVNQSEANFSFGWENASYLRAFVTGFVIRVFYEGDAAVAVNISLTSSENPTALTGMGLLAVSAAPLCVLVLDSKRQPLWQALRV